MRSISFVFQYLALELRELLEQGTIDAHVFFERPVHRVEYSSSRPRLDESYRVLDLEIDNEPVITVPMKSFRYAQLVAVGHAATIYPCLVIETRRLYY